MQIILPFQARIALSFKPRDATKQSYEVVLGENQNTQAAIYYKSASGSTVENTRTAFNSLTAANYKSFWISWTEEDNHIRVGKEGLEFNIYYRMLMVGFRK